MSDFSETSTCSSLSVPNSKVADLIAITETLNKAARLLLDFGRKQEPPDSESVESDRGDVAHDAIQKDYARGCFHEEIRCYRLPRHIVRREYELLREHKQDNLLGLINQAHGELAATVMLMRHIDDSADLSGFDLHLIGESLARPLKIFDVICSQLADFELVKTTVVPA